jgi:hypothetical protein
MSAARAEFEQMRPEIELRARHAFRRAGPERIEELVAEVTAHAFEVFIYLAQHGKANLAYAKPLAASAIRQVRIARRLPPRRPF